MLKVDELEKKWYQYRVKKVVLPMLGVTLSTAILVGAYYLYNTKNYMHFLSSNKVSKAVLGVTKDLNSMQNIVEKKVEVVVVKQKEELSLEPIIPVIDMEKEERIKYTKKVHSKKENREMVRAKPNTYLTAKELAAISHVKKVQSPKPHVTKKMKFTVTSANYIETMKEKFSKSKNPREALLLAKAYYKEGKYKEAEKWAFSANKLNNSLEESWFLFAKSKAKLGKKKEALKILVTYYKKSHSLKTKELIGQIKTGKI